jgi:hypothetical protein
VHAGLPHHLAHPRHVDRAAGGAGIGLDDDHVRVVAEQDPAAGSAHTAGARTVTLAVCRHGEALRDEPTTDAIRAFKEPGMVEVIGGEHRPELADGLAVPEHGFQIGRGHGGSPAKGTDGSARSF